MSTLPEGIRPVHDLDEAWRAPRSGARARAVRLAGERLHEAFAGGPRIVSVRTFPLATLPYPTRYAFGTFAVSLAPYVTLTHRCALVQFMQGGALKNLLFNPTDVVAARAAPYFDYLVRRVGARAVRMLSKSFPPLEEQLGQIGVLREDIDYVAFDHFHLQDLRSLLGTLDGAHVPRFPNAVLLAPKPEWDDWDDLHPIQRAWFVEDGKRGVRTSRVALTEGDLALGDGVMLLRTPGHTSGNQTLFFNTEQGVWGISENGTASDNWSPRDSKIPGLAARCRREDVDVALNTNTRESGADQYTSMLLERAMVDRLHRAPAFVQMFPSSEVTPSVTAPGLRPTVLHRGLSLGDIARSSRAAVAAQ